MTPQDEQFIEAARRGDLNYVKANFLTVQKSEPILYNPILAESFVFSPSIEICSYFLEHGFDVNETYRQNYKSDMYEFSWIAITALWQATFTNNRPKMEFLIAHGADVNIPVTDIYGEYRDSSLEPLYRSSALMEAVNNQQISCVRILLQTGANANYRDSSGTSALDIARRKGNVDILSLLSTFTSSSLIGFDSINHSDVFGETPLLKAVKKGSIEEVKNLIAKGADVNFINQFKESVLMVAVKKNQPEIVKLLVETGADVNYKDNFGKSVLQIAKQKGFTEIVELLKSAGAKE